MGIDVEIFARTRAPLTDDDVRTLAYRLCEAVGPSYFFLDREGKYGDGPQHALTKAEEITQDGPTIVPEPGEVFVHVNTLLRYYGPDYERGPWPVLRAIGAWLAANVGEVWYGGDSSGVVARPWSECEAENQAHWLRLGGLPYSQGFDRDPPLRSYEFCRESMIRNGWGGAYARVFCPGCGLAEVSRDNGETWTEEKAQ